LRNHAFPARSYIGPDGIIGLNVGEETNLSKEDRVRQIADALNQQFKAYSEETYRSLVTDKSLLDVLDDGCSSDAVAPFQITAGRSRLICTSRDKGLVGPLVAEDYEVDILDKPEARNFLAAWVGKEQELMPEPYASEIFGRVPRTRSRIGHRRRVVWCRFLVVTASQMLVSRKGTLHDCSGQAVRLISSVL
jgi:hypothetical protein